MIWRMEATHLLKRLGQSSACGSVAFGRTENLRPVALQPAPMVLFTLKALVGYILWSPGESRSHARQPRVATVTHCEEGLGRWLIFGRSRGETETCYDARGINSDEQAKSFVPSQTIAPSDVGLSSQPSLTPSDLGISDGHRRAVQGLVGTALSLHITAARCKATSSISPTQERTNRLNCELASPGSSVGKASCKWLVA